MFLVREKSQLPEKIKRQTLIDFKLSINCGSDFVPMPFICCNHGFVLQVTDKWDEHCPSLDFFSDSGKSITFSISNLDGIETLSHFLDLVFHLIDIHLVPSEFQKLIESLFTFLDVFPEFLHPPNFSLNDFNDLLTSIGLSF